MPAGRFVQRALMLFVLASAAEAADAHAYDCAQVTSGCIDDDTLWAHAGAATFVGVGGAETIAPGEMGVGLVTSYLHHPVVASLAIAGAAPSRVALADHQLDATFLWAVGVVRNFELDLAVPATMFETGAGMDAITGSGSGLAATAMRSARFGFLYTLLTTSEAPHGKPSQDGPSARLSARFDMAVPTATRGSFAGETSAVFAPSLTAEVGAGRWFGGAEAGARLRPPGELLGARVGTELVLAAGVGFNVLDWSRLDVLVEARSLPVVVAQSSVAFTAGRALTTAPSNASLTPSEWMLSARSRPWQTTPLTLQLGLGGALTSAVTTPDLRVVFGVRYAPTVAP